MGICGGATADSGDCAISKRNMTYKSVKSGKVSHIAIPVLKDSVYIMGGGGIFWEESSYDIVVNIVNCVRNVSIGFVI